MQPVWEISFGQAGNAGDFQIGGWSTAGQTDLTYAIGPASRLRLPEFPTGSDLLVILEGEPADTLPHGREQRIRVLLDDKPIGHFVIDGVFMRSLRIKGAALQKGSVLEFRQPDKMPPRPGNPFGKQRLSVAWRRMRFFDVTRARLPSSANVPSAKGPTEDDRFMLAEATSISGLSAFSLSELLYSCTSTPSQRFVRSANMRYHLVGINADLPNDVSLVRCSIGENGTLSFSFPQTWLDRRDSDPVRDLVFERWKAVLPVFEAYMTTGRISGSVVISLGDEAHAKGLAFCGRTRDTLLIPDPYFLRSLGYDDLRRWIAERAPQFEQRKPVALWRGSSTGYREDGGLLDLGRVKLCRLGKRLEAADLLDVGLTSLVQLKNEAEGHQLRALGLMAEFVAPDRLTEWMFHIDVDGNTNSWPGLFQKLLSGSLVFKIKSACSWRQWYYDRLVPHVNFVPIASDLSDLVETVTYYRENVPKAKEIAENGRSLANAMTYGAEVARAMRVIEDGVAREHLGRP